jgi:hypothetical protein
MFYRVIAQCTQALQSIEVWLDEAEQHVISQITTPTAIFAHPPFFKTRSVDAGYFDNSPRGRRGRTTSSPPQLGHSPDKMSDEHFAQ